MLTEGYVEALGGSIKCTGYWCRDRSKSQGGAEASGRQPPLWARFELGELEITHPTHRFDRDMALRNAEAACTPRARGARASAGSAIDELIDWPERAINTA